MGVGQPEARSEENAVNVALWILQGVLAAALLMAGGMIRYFRV